MLCRSAKWLHQGKKFSLSAQNSTFSSLMTLHEKDVVDLRCIQDAAVRISQFVRKTPVLTSSFMNKLSGRSLFFKCELFQKTGSFKFRGACNAVIRLKNEKKSTPVVVTHSSGNHGQALCLAAHMNGIKAIVVVPNNAPQAKRNAMLAYHGQLVECAPSATARAEAADRVLAGLGDRGEYVPSGDHPFIFSGQGTAALELMEQVPHLDAVITCSSMGGFLSGVAVACKSLDPHVKVYSAEPQLAGSTCRSLQDGKRYTLQDYPKTVADGLRMSVGKNSWSIIHRLVDRGFVVSEKQIVDTMYLIYERMKVVVEPSGAVPLAVVLSDEFKALPSAIRNVGVFLSGGNVDLNSLPWFR